MKPIFLHALFMALVCLSFYGEETKQEQAPENKKVTNTGFVRTLDEFCRQSNMQKEERGAGKVKVILVGKGKLGDETTKMTAAGEQTLKALEIFTGQQGVFWNDLDDVTREHLLVLFLNDADYLAYVDFLRKYKVLPENTDRNDLVKELLGFSAPLASITVASKATLFPNNFAVHMITFQAVQAFFMERGNAPIPPWLTEGLSAELQKELCGGTVRCASIAYEMSSPEMQGNWAQDVAGMIKKNDKMLRKASDVMGFNLASLPGAHYKLMWSVCTMFVKSASSKKGDKNKFYILMDEIAKGGKAEDAVKKAYGVGEPALTQTWFSWAVTQK